VSSGRLAAWLVVVAVIVPLALGSATGCKRSSAATVTADPGDAPIVKPDSEGLLLTWIDDKGDFQVQTRVADVPMIGRDSVRVVDPNKDEGTHADRVFVADLRQQGTDGTFPVRTMTRSEFEAIAVARREKTGPTLASAAPTQPPPPGTAQGHAGDDDSARKPSARSAVIIYGAEWCGACHDAARYLRSKGIAFVEKDVEKDPGAAREMQQKLAHNGLHSGSIPVIDVRGHVMVGFNPHEVDDALGQAL
jgi:glutaredoxin